MGNFMRVLTENDEQFLMNKEAIAYLRIRDSVHGGNILSAVLVNGDVVFIKEILNDSVNSIREFTELENN